MLRRALQRLLRIAPGPARAAWARVPAPIKERLAPLVHPLAAERRGGALVLDVPLCDPARPAIALCGFDERRVRELDAHLRAVVPDHRIVVTAGDPDPSEPGLLDVVALVPNAEAAAPRRGWRTLTVAAKPLPSAADVAERFPTVTVVVPTRDNGSLVESCIHALRRNTGWPTLETVVVDNGSSDDTAARLGRLATGGDLLVLRNETNRGFAAACNQAIRHTESELVVLLNDDTVVGPGWLSRLVAHLEDDDSLGVVCPVTNEIGNEAKVPVTYTDLEGMEAFAFERAGAYAGRRRPTRVVPLFCAAAKRSTLEAVGLLDERYEVGMFEDDDLSLALEAAGYRSAIALDAFVHHVGQASFGKLDDATYLAIWEANKQRFEHKWGVRWTPPESGARHAPGAPRTPHAPTTRHAPREPSGRDG